MKPASRRILRMAEEAGAEVVVLDAVVSGAIGISTVDAVLELEQGLEDLGAEVWFANLAPPSRNGQEAATVAAVGGRWPTP